ncbi:MAG TPA: HEAT repeat domain-containing protein [Planctomycetota bacterium]|nr:HEAT repeat domain-containing protein [Planctomycetota bacterium]
MARSPAAEALHGVEELAQQRDVVALGDLLESSAVPSARRRAMDVLFSIASSEALDTLADAASRAEMGLNEEILYKLRETPGESSLRALGRVLSSENGLRRALVVSLVAARREPLAMTVLLRAARDPSKAVARIGEKALLSRVTKEPNSLGELPRESVAGIVSFLEFELARDLVAPEYPPVVREEAARRLGKAGGGDAVATLIALTAESEAGLVRAAWEGLRGVGTLPATFLLPFLGDRSEEVRRQGAELFARCCGPEGAMIVAALLRDGAPRVRETAARAVFTLQGEPALPSLRRLLEDADERVRTTVVDLLARWPTAAEDLARVVLREKGALAERALTALASWQVYRPELSNAYRTYLDEHATETKPAESVIDAMASIAKILGDVHEPGALHGFAALCRTTSRRLRRTGIEAILQFPVDVRADVLVSLADTHDRAMLGVIAVALGEANDPRATIPLIRASAECSGRAIRRARELLAEDAKLQDLNFVLELLFNRWPSVRKFSAESLRKSEDPRVVPPLLKASEDEDVEVQLASIEALGAFAKTEATVVERLLGVMDIGDITVRQAAIEALGAAQIQEAVPGIIKALHNVFLRPRAEESLKRIGGRQGYLAMKRLHRRETLFGKKNRRRPERKRIQDC